MKTKRLVYILEETHAAWEACIKGDLTYNDKVVMPNTLVWGIEEDTVCLSCVAGSYYLASTGKLLNFAGVDEIEHFINILRKGNDSVKAFSCKEDTSVLFKRILPFLPENLVFDSIHAEDHKLVLEYIDQILKSIYES